MFKLPERHEIDELVALCGKMKPDIFAIASAGSAVLIALYRIFR